MKPVESHSYEPRVFLVGAGPGDPELITVRGLSLLQRADVVLYDHLISDRLVQQIPSTTEKTYVGKRSGKHLYSQEQINDMMIRAARTGKTVVRLKGGDPYVFGRGGEEALALHAAGVAFEVVPGITAAFGAAAYAGIPLTQRGLAGDVAFITGHEDISRVDDSQIDWEALARWRGSIVFYMGIYRIADICRRLIGFGMAADTPAAVVTWAADPRQKTRVSTLGELPRIHEQMPFHPPGLIIIGKAVTLRESLAWYERRPLFGRRIMVTRASEQAGELVQRLIDLGAVVTECPTIRIADPPDPGPLRQAIDRLQNYSWVVFTSINAVERVFAELHKSGRDARGFGAGKICAVGSSTATRLENFGIEPDLVPPTYHAESLAEALTQSGISGKRILLPRSPIAREALPRLLRQAGAEVEEVIAYQTLPEDSGKQWVPQFLAEQPPDWITFTSSSTVSGFLQITDAALIQNKGICLASIGPQTSATLRRAGLEPTVEADPHTLDGLIAALCAKKQDDPQESS